jgi:hypothetical protein
MLQGKKISPPRFACLIFPVSSVILRAMFRLVILLVSIIWASLLLISWSSPPDSAAQQAPPVKIAS